MQKYRYFLLFFCCLFTSLASGSTDTLKVAYTRAAPFIITGEGQPAGISIWLWDKIARNLEIDYELIEMGFGDILQGLENGTVDASINPLTVTSERSKKMNFTYPFYAANATVAIKKTTTVQKFLQFLGDKFIKRVEIKKDSFSKGESNVILKVTINKIHTTHKKKNQVL